MKCERVREALSASMDGEPIPVSVRTHLEGCADCREFAFQLEQLKGLATLLGSQPFPVPDVTERVLARLPRKRPALRRWSVATGFAFGALIGVVVAGGFSGPRTSLARELPEAVVAAQAAVHRLTASFTITESITPDTRRTYAGELAYRSPEFLTIAVNQIDGPDGWAENSWSLGIDGEVAVVISPFPCPALGGCIEGEPRRRVTTGRDPFSVLVPAPLDAVVPASVLRNSTNPEHLVAADLLGRPSIAFAVTAAQADSLLKAYFEVGNWREIHPSDAVAIWLDQESFIPLRVAVAPGPSTDRSLWAARRGYRDEPGTPYLVVDYVEVDLSSEVVGEIEMVEEEPALDAGFRVDPSLVPPIETGVPLIKAGTVTAQVPTRVWAWSNGRAWIRLDLTTEWGGSGLFGNDGSGVRMHELAGGPIFESGGGDKVFVHADGFDAVVSGSVATSVLMELASGIPGSKSALPADWPESPADSGAIDRAWLPGTLGEYKEPIVRATGETVLVDLFAAGGRSVLITLRPASLLTPPLDPDAHAVEVRGTTGRYSPMLGLLEWTEGTTSVSVGSASASLDELLEIASTLVKP